MVFAGSGSAFAENRRPWPGAIGKLLSERDIRLYSHQAPATDHIRAGHSIVAAATPTAKAAKVLIYNLPVLEGHLLDPEARALYLFSPQSPGPGPAAILQRPLHKLARGSAPHSRPGTMATPVITCAAKSGADPPITLIAKSPKCSIWPFCPITSNGRLFHGRTLPTLWLTRPIFTAAFLASRHLCEGFFAG